MQVKFVQKNMLLFALGWTLMVATAMGVYLWLDREHTIEVEAIRARTLLERDMLYRSWGVTKGGVYVRVTKDHQPNPHMAFLPNRDIILGNGEMLTLMTPSNITQQAFELSNKSGDTLSKITALKVVNPSNLADDWERDAIRRFELGVREVTGVGLLAGKPYLRTMRPFITEKKCIKCHSAQGYDVGQIRGGLSISTPLEPALVAASKKNRPVIGLLVCLWGVGICGISWQCRKLKRQTGLAIEHEMQREQAENNLYYMTNFDRRTNLPNRHYFAERLTAVLKGVEVKDSKVAVIALELRNLKRIKETNGEVFADHYLKACAERISGTLHSENIIARYDDNRLIISLSYYEDHLALTNLLQMITDVLSTPLEVSGEMYFPEAWMGVSLSPSDGSVAGPLIQMATAALERATLHQESGFEMYSQSLQADAMEYMAIETGLRVALEQDQLELHFQPQIDATSGQVVGAEALLRWTTAAGLSLSPVKFIPVAEESGLILSIGSWVLRTACHQAVSWHKEMGQYLQVGVNVSAKQFSDPGFVDHVDKVLNETGLPPEFLEIEITEGTFIEDPQRTVEILTDLKVRGLKIALDDFGTGYSSLNYLKKFPIDRLKVDRSFVVDIAEDEDDKAIVSLITDISRSLGMGVVAEGVEDVSQRDVLLSMGCTEMQGFYYSKPLEAGSFLSYLKFNKLDQ